MINPTNFIHKTALFEATGVEIVLISELEQRTASFKFRAAWNVVDSIDAGHFLAASSGNFGQALACACRLKNRGCTIVMPANSARVKIEAVASHGGSSMLR